MRVCVFKIMYFYNLQITGDDRVWQIYNSATHAHEGVTLATMLEDCGAPSKTEVRQSQQVYVEYITNCYNYYSLLKKITKCRRTRGACQRPVAQL
jgi:hypothetical protein